jgi:aspartyl protease family protein
MARAIKTGKISAHHTLFTHDCLKITMRLSLLNAIIFIATTAVSMPTIGQNVTLSGVLGNKALIVVDGAAPKSLAAGESHMGVKLVSASGEQAVVEIKGKRNTLRVGDAPVSVGGGAGSPNGTRIVLPVGSGGHFMASGQINGRAVQFMVDTGATSVAMGEGDAQRIGIDYRKGRPVQMGTANGVAQGWLVKLNSVRVGDVEVYEVDAVVGPNMPFVLLGNSFLSRFTMNRNSDTMVLERRF